MVFKGVPTGSNLGQQYNVGKKPTAILYTYINLHAGTPVIITTVLHGFEYSTTVDNSTIETYRNRGLGIK